MFETSICDTNVGSQTSVSFTDSFMNDSLQHLRQSLLQFADVTNPFFITAAL